MWAAKISHLMSERRNPTSQTPGQPQAERPSDESSFSYVEAVLVFAAAVGLFWAGYEIHMYG